jgi:predicted RNA methylase
MAPQVVSLSDAQDRRLEDDYYDEYLARLPARTQRDILAKREFYFRVNVHPRTLQHILVDEEASYSITESALADRTSALIRDVCGAGVATVTDATACVGGNTASFAHYFEHVNAFELDEQRARYLWHNCKRLCRAGTFTVIHGDFTDPPVQALVEQDVVFFDPPWGGPGYKDRPADSLHLSLSGRDMAAVCASLHRGGATRFVCLKVPWNFAFTDFSTDTRQFADVVCQEDIRDQRGRLKFVVLILRMQRYY